MLILNKTVVNYCQIRRQDSDETETGIRWGDQVYACSMTFCHGEEQQAMFYAKTCGATSLIVQHGQHLEVWCLSATHVLIDMHTPTNPSISAQDLLAARSQLVPTMALR